MRPYHFLIPLTLIVGSFFLFLGGPGDFASRSVRELWNLGHIAYFTLLIYQLIQWGLLEKFRLPTQWAIYLLITFVLGTSIELLQYGTQRSPDVADISRDLMGGVLALAFSSRLLAMSSRRFINVIRPLAVVLLVMHLVPLTRASVDEVNAFLRFPVISDFETPFELDRWRGSATREVVNIDPEKSDHQMKIGFGRDLYSSASMRYLPGDWSAYTTLHIRLFQPEFKPLRITIRIHDEQHETAAVSYLHNDRFNRRFVLHQGWNDIAISLSEVRQAPKKRQMDLTRVRNINLFTSRLSREREVFLEAVYLTD